VIITLTLIAIAILLLVLVLANDKAKSALLTTLAVVGMVIGLAVFGYLVQSVVGQ